VSLAQMNCHKYEVHVLMVLLLCVKSCYIKNWWFISNVHESYCYSCL